MAVEFLVSSTVSVVALVFVTLAIIMVSTMMHAWLCV